MSLRFVCCGIVVLGLSVTAEPAFGQDVPAAREHFRRGTALFELGKYKEAAVEYEAAYVAKNDPALLFNIAQSYRLADDTEQALRAYEGYLRKVKSPPNRVEVEARIHDLKMLIDEKRQSRERPPMGTMTPTVTTSTGSSAGSAEGRDKPPVVDEGPPGQLPRADKPPEAPPPPAAATVAPNAAPAEKKPIYKKWWFWTAIGGVVVVGAVVGIAVGVAKAPHDNFSPSLGKVGPGALLVFP